MLYKKKTSGKKNSFNISESESSILKFVAKL